MMTLTIEEARAIYMAQIARYQGTDALKATRTEIHAALQLRNPPPYSDHPPHLPKQVSESRAFTREEAEEIRAHQRMQVTDAEHLEFSKSRAEHPYILDAHHYVQWKHGKALWVEADRLLAQLMGGGS